MNAKHLQLVRGIALAILLNVTYTASAFYDPTRGRWINRDPIGEPGFLLATGTKPEVQYDDSELGIASTDSPAEPGLYAFVRNDPQSRIDALGLFRSTDAMPHNKLI